MARREDEHVQLPYPNGRFAVGRGPARLRRFARAEVVTLGLAAGAGFLMGTPYAAVRPLAFLSDLAYNAQTRVEYKGLTGEATSYLAYASLLADAVTLPSLIAALVGLGALGARASRSGPEGRKALVLALAFAAPFVLVASGGHRAMRFLAPAWPALAWLAAEALGSVRDRLPRRLASAAVVARAAVAALLVLRLFLVDSRGLATRFLAEHVPPGANIDLIANHAGYAPEAPEGLALRMVPTLSRIGRAFSPDGIHWLWRLRRPDKNIDHRRVPKLQTYFARRGYRLHASGETDDFRPGDLVTCIVPPSLHHIMIISDKKNAKGIPLVIHNIGSGAREEDRLVEFRLTGHYRIKEVESQGRGDARNRTG